MENIEICDILDISSIPLEGEDMTRESMFHNHYAIYLYCTVEREVAERITNGDISATPIPIKLYESKEISKAMAKNIRNKVTLKIAVNLFVNQNQLYYDQLMMSKEFKNALKQRVKCKTDNELENMCLYTRKIIQNALDGMPIIEYTINNFNILMNPQYASIL